MIDTRSEFVLRGTNRHEATKFVSLPQISSLRCDAAESFRNHEINETSVTLFDSDHFRQDFMCLKQSRPRAAKLTESHDFTMAPSPYEHRGDLLVGFVLANALATVSVGEGYCPIKGDFVLHGEWVASALQGMKALLDVAA